MIAMPVHSFVDLADSRRGKYRSAPRVGIWGEHPVGRSGAGQNHVGRRGGRDRAEAWTLRRRIDDAERLWLGVERLAGGREDRQLVALNDAAMGLRLRRATYLKIAAESGSEISEQTAGRDLKALADLGYLEPHGEGAGASTSRHRNSAMSGWESAGAAPCGTMPTRSRT